MTTKREIKGLGSDHILSLRLSCELHCNGEATQSQSAGAGLPVSGHRELSTRAAGPRQHRIFTHMHEH